MERDATVERLLGKVARDRWVATLDGGLPQVPIRDTLPTAGIDFAYRLIAIRGTPDIVYCCLRNAGGTWGWRTAATG